MKTQQMCLGCCVDGLVEAPAGQPLLHTCGKGPKTKLAESTCPYCLVNGKVLSSALDQCVEALERLRQSVNWYSFAPYVCDEPGQLDTVGDVISTALEQARKARGE